MNTADIINNSTVAAGVWGQKLGTGSQKGDYLAQLVATITAADATSVAYLYDGEVDSTDDTVLTNFSNITDPLTVVNAVTTYTHITFATNLLIKIENEVLKVTGVAGNDVTFARSQGGTTAASHAAGVNIYTLTAIPIVPSTAPIKVYSIPMGIESKVGAWRASCGAGVSLIATGGLS